MPTHTWHIPPRICERGVTAVSRAPRTSCFPLSTRCGIHALERPFSFPHHLLYAASAAGGSAMTFEEILDQAIAMLQRRGRLTYGALKRQFQLDDAYLEDVKAELIEGQRLAADEDGRVLVWTGGASTPPESVAFLPPHQEEPLAAPHTRVASPAAEPHPADAE